MSKKKYITSIVIYLSILYIIAIFHLYFKHSGGADSTISEWLINYQGGFTRRGLIGEIVFQISKLSSLTIRETILTFQNIKFIFIPKIKFQ